MGDELLTSLCSSNSNATRSWNPSLSSSTSIPQLAWSSSSSISSTVDGSNISDIASLFIDYSSFAPPMDSNHDLPSSPTIIDWSEPLLSGSMRSFSLNQMLNHIEKQEHEIPSSSSSCNPKIKQVLTIESEPPTASGKRKKVNETAEEQIPKKARIQMPSSLPTFNVRKEKLQDRVTALQQLVSPFGKTDTASVLHEAIEYIKFLRDQIEDLCVPYLKSGNSMHNHHPQKEAKDWSRDLRSRGLCMVPVSTAFGIAQEHGTDFNWSTSLRSGQIESGF